MSFNKLVVGKNNFDLLRFLFAVIVFLVHSYVLSGAHSLSILSKLLSSELAVKCFFIVSGFLIFMSYENTAHNGRFFLKRARRIYPAYFTVVLLCTLIGSVLTTYSFSDYWSFPTLKYIIANLFFLNFLAPNLPGLFEVNTVHAVNGALWTLKIEVMFYIAVPLIAFCFNRFGRLLSMALLFLGSVVYSYVLLALTQSHGGGDFVELQRQLPGQLTFFIAGAVGYYYIEAFKKYVLYLVPISILAFVLKVHLPWIVLEPLALGILVIYFAIIFPYLGNFGKYGDFSYGIYILHFPILQLLIAIHLFVDSPVLFITVAAALVLVFSILLWHFIEKPFLRKGSHYVAKQGY